MRHVGTAGLSPYPGVPALGHAPGAREPGEAPPSLHRSLSASGGLGLVAGGGPCSQAPPPPGVRAGLERRSRSSWVYPKGLRPHVLPSLPRAAGRAPALLCDLGLLAEPAWRLLPATTASLCRLSSSRPGLLLFDTLWEKVAVRRKPWFGPGPARGAGRLRGGWHGGCEGSRAVQAGVVSWPLDLAHAPKMQPSPRAPWGL